MLHTRKIPNRSLAEVPLGGITIYGESHDKVVGAISAVTNDIHTALSSQLCMTKRGFQGKICESILAEHPERIFSAIFGRMISEGRIQIAECLAMNGSRYRTYYASTKRSALEGALQATFNKISKSATCALKDIESELFGKRAWGTWTQTAMIADILAVSGLVTHVNRFEVKLSLGSGHAASKLKPCEFNILGGIMASNGLLPF